MASNPSDPTTTPATDLTPTDLTHLRRAVELAAESLAAGDAPFGSVLVLGGGVLAEDRNRIVTLNDATKHPEFELARWAAVNLPSAEERKAVTVYTSGEHCPMCSAAHAYVGLGRIVYVASAKQLEGWQREFRRERLGVEEEEEQQVTVAGLPIQTVAPGIEVLGPVPELEKDIWELHRAYAARKG
ncbi:cytidine/deoxycytidylate deaminase [Xylariaceae sp. FL0255]|nr:cytidine/deoxycytidylate deaminase [Xylariaceae sp. FL0255]